MEFSSVIALFQAHMLVFYALLSDLVMIIVTTLVKSEPILGFLLTN
jgi:hypothetical protein